MKIERTPENISEEVANNFFESKNAERFDKPQVSRLRRLSIGIGIPVVAMVIPGIGTNWAMDNEDHASIIARGVLGDNIVDEAEKHYFVIEDRKNRLLFKIDKTNLLPLKLGPEEKPYETPTEFVSTIYYSSTLEDGTQTPKTIQTLVDGFPLIPQPDTPFIAERPRQFILPQVEILLENPIEGEGQWSGEGLPTADGETLMARAFIRPDSSRPYSNVTALVVDGRRVKLNAVGGKGSPDIGGGSGPGEVPDNEMQDLLLVMNGGFQRDHASWGMYLDGIVYKPLQNGYASLVVLQDGSIKIGTWGEGELSTRTDEMVAVRQNSVLLVENGEVTNAALSKEMDVNIWGRVLENSTQFVTWRSGIGLTKEGHIMIAIGSNMSAKSFAKGMKALGAKHAMQFDINSSWTQAGIAHKALNGPTVLTPMRDGIENGSKFLSPQTRDLIYITRDDDSRYK